MINSMFNAKRAARDYFFLRNGHQLGPLYERELLALCPGGRCAESDLVWREGWDEWRQAGEFVAALYAARQRRKKKIVLAAAGACVLAAGTWAFFADRQPSFPVEPQIVPAVSIGTGERWASLDEAKAAVRKALASAEPYSAAWCVLAEYDDALADEGVEPLDVGNSRENKKPSPATREVLTQALFAGDAGMLSFLDWLGLDRNFRWPFVVEQDIPYGRQRIPRFLGRQTPFQAALMLRNKDLTEYFIQRAAPEERKNAGPLFAAAAYADYTHGVRRLLASGFSIPEKDSYSCDKTDSYLDFAHSPTMRHLLKKAGAWTNPRLQMRQPGEKREGAESPPAPSVLDAIASLERAIGKGDASRVASMLNSDPALCAALADWKSTWFKCGGWRYTGWTIFLKQAVREDHPEIFRVLREGEKKHARDNARTDGDYFSLALDCGSVRVAQFLAENGKWNSWQLLNLCSRGGSSAVAEALLKNGAGEALQAGRYESTLASAVRGGSLPLVRLLVEHGVADGGKTRRPRADEVSRALTTAWAEGKPAITRYLEKKFSQARPEHERALIEAVDCGKLNAVGELLRRGVSAKAALEKQRNLMLWASNQRVNARSTAMVALLLKSGANSIAGNEEGVTPLMKAVRNKNMRLFRFLKASGAHLNAETRDGRTALFYASRSLPMMKELLRTNRFSINTRDKNGTTFFLRLAEMAGWGNADEELAKLELLIDHGADVKAQDKQGHTALHLRAKKLSGHDGFEEKIVSLLVKRGLSPNVKNNAGDTPLAMLVKSEDWSEARQKLAEALVHGGADVNACDALGVAPLDWARRKRWREGLVRFLEREGALPSRVFEKFGFLTATAELSDGRGRYRSPETHEIVWRCGSPVTATNVSLVILRTYGGDPYGDGYTHIAELELLDANGNPLPRTGWKASTSSQDGPEAAASRVLDGDPKTSWHSRCKQEFGGMLKPPHRISLKFPSAVTFSAVRLTYRNIGDAWSFFGRPRDVELRVMHVVPMERGQSMEVPKGRDYVLKPESTVTDVEELTLTVEGADGGTVYAHLAEINLLDRRGNLLPRQGWSVEATSVERSSENGDVTRLLDGNEGTVWHSRYSGGGDKPPHRITVRFPSPVDFYAIRLTDRWYGIPGRPTRVRVDWKRRGEEKSGDAEQAEETGKDKTASRSAPMILVDLTCQRLALINGGREVFSCPVSSGREGAGSDMDSGKTPVGRFFIHSKIGDGWPEDTVFVGKEAAGWRNRPGLPDAARILGRILPLEGLEPGNLNTRQRDIYIHGTNRVGELGTPASHGCIRLSPEAVVALHDLVEEKTEVFIFESRPACDVRLSRD